MAAWLGLGAGCGRTDLEPEAAGDGAPVASSTTCDPRPRRLTRDPARWVTLGDGFAYVSSQEDVAGHRTITRVSVEGGEETRVHEGDTFASERIVTDGRFLYWLGPGGVEVRVVPVGGGAERVVIDDPADVPLIGVDVWIWPAGGDVYVTNTDAIFRGRPDEGSGQQVLVEPKSGEILWLAAVDLDHVYHHAMSCRQWCQLGVDTPLYRRDRRGGPPEPVGQTPTNRMHAVGDGRLAFLREDAVYLLDLGSGQERVVAEWERVGSPRGDVELVGEQVVWTEPTDVVGEYRLRRAPVAGGEPSELAAPVAPYFAASGDCVAWLDGEGILWVRGIR